MPRGYDLLPAAQRKVPNDPTNRISFDIRRFLGEYPFGSPEALVENAIKAVEDFVQMLLSPDGVDQLMSLVNGFLNALVTAPETLLQLVESVVAMLLSPQGLEQLTSLVEGLVNSLIHLPEILINLAEGLLSSDAGFMGPDSPLNAQNLFNSIAPHLMGLVSVSHVGQSNPNLLANPKFEGVESVQGAGLWFWDATEGRTTPGSAYTTASGALKQLVSNEIPVTAGQKLDMTVFSKWSGLAYTGTSPIKVQVVRLLNYVPVGTDDLAAPSNPVATQASWTQLGGAYTVPAGCDMVCMQFTVTPTATAGTVRFDDGDIHKTGLMSGNWMQGISGTVASDLQSTVDQAFQAVFGGSSTGNPLTSLKTTLSSYGLPNIPDLQSIADNITNAFVGMGNSFLGTNPTQARQSMDSIYDEFLGLTQKVQDMRSNQTAIDVSGKTVTVNFNDLADGPLPSSFTVTYSGPGTSAIGVTDGAAGWRTKNNNGNRTAVITYNVEPTSSDYQVVRGTLTGAPPSDNGGSKPRIAAIGRVDNPANPLNYVWARGYNDGFLTYKGDVGCTINGVDTVWISGISLTWSMDINFIIGVGGNPRRYQVFSGTQLVRDFVEPGTASLLGAAYRYWGCKTELKTDSGKAIAPPSIVGTSVSDNAPPNVVGSGAMMTRRSATEVGMPTGAREFAANFFTQTDAISPDITPSLSSGSFFVSISGWYLVNVGLLLSGALFENNCLALFRNGTVVRVGGTRLNEHIAQSTTFSYYFQAGDRVSAGTYRDSGSNDVMIGDASGVWTYFSIALTNRSYA